MKLIALSGLVLALCACETRGVGSGALQTTEGAEAPRSASVHFSWRSEGPSPAKGTISATVPGHGEFHGNYLQITEQTQGIDVNPYLGGGWHPAWNTWDGWGPGWGGETFITHYTGRVIAILESRDGASKMRCRFRLTEPAKGPVGGGRGECELSNGDMVTFVVLEGR
jgi:hypothetical protein